MLVVYRLGGRGCPRIGPDRLIRNKRRASNQNRNGKDRRCINFWGRGQASIVQFRCNRTQNAFMHGFIMLMIFNMRVRSNEAVCNSNVNRTDQAEQAVTLKMIRCNAHG